MISWKFSIVVIALTWITLPANEVCSQPTVCLRAYDADKELKDIQNWYNMVKDPIREKTAEGQLQTESCDTNKKKKYPSMCRAFTASRKKNKCIPGLIKAECIAVLMYSADDKGFYQVYNKESNDKNWDPFKVYTTLLFSGLKKMSAKQKMPLIGPLYRGLDVTCTPPTAKRIFWKTFTSTTLDKKTAEKFGKKTLFVFHNPGTKFGAKISELSFFPSENEVLISPFEAFDFVSTKQTEIKFKASEKQELLGGKSTAHPSGFQRGHGEKL